SAEPQKAARQSLSDRPPKTDSATRTAPPAPRPTPSRSDQTPQSLQAPPTPNATRSRAPPHQGSFAYRRAKNRPQTKPQSTPKPATAWRAPNCFSSAHNTLPASVLRLLAHSPASEDAVANPPHAPARPPPQYD